MHSSICHNPSWDQSRNFCKAQGNLCRGSCSERKWLQADGWHGLSGDRENISVAVIRLRGDTPFPPTLLPYKAGVLLWLDKAVEALCGLPRRMGSQQSAEGISTGDR